MGIMPVSRARCEGSGLRGGAEGRWRAAPSRPSPTAGAGAGRGCAWRPWRSHGAVWGRHGRPGRSPAGAAAAGEAGFLHNARRLREEQAAEAKKSHFGKETGKC